MISKCAAWGSSRVWNASESDNRVIIKKQHSWQLCANLHWLKKKKKKHDCVFVSRRRNQTFYRLVLHSASCRISNRDFVMSDSDMIPSERGNSTFYHQGRHRVWLMWCLQEREKGRAEATAVREHKLQLACGHNWTFCSVPVSITGAHFRTCFLSLPSKTKLHEGYLIRLLPSAGHRGLS